MGQRRLRLVAYGFGRVGSAVVELALTRPWLVVTGIIARRAERDGEPAQRTVASAPADLVVRTDADAVLAEARPDAVIVATRSRLADVRPQLELAARSGARAIVCSAEELAHARPDRDEHAAAIHALARRGGVAIVAAGVNPGFVLDLWPLVLSGLAWDVERLSARRVVDVSVFAPHVRSDLGIGHTPAAFEAGLAEGRILGHLGFPESLRILTEAMGRPAERIEVQTEPVIAERAYRVEGTTVERGHSIAVRQLARAWVDGRAWIEIEMLLHAAPAEDGVRTTDETHLSGRHELHVGVDPGCGAITGTAALLVNAIPRALSLPPGVYGPGDLPPIAPWLAPALPHVGDRPVVADPALV